MNVASTLASTLSRCYSAHRQVCGTVGFEGPPEGAEGRPLGRHHEDTSGQGVTGNHLCDWGKGQETAGHCVQTVSLRNKDRQDSQTLRAVLARRTDKVRPEADVTAQVLLFISSSSEPSYWQGRREIKKLHLEWLPSSD